MAEQKDKPAKTRYKASSVIKVIPRNLTARADYVVPGNPFTSRPESGVDISFPGLEFDQRNLDQRFFPGLYFEFQRQDGVILAKLELKDNQLVSGLSEGDLARPLFLLGLYGRTMVEDKEPRFFGFPELHGPEIWRRVHDLLPGRVAIIFGPGWPNTGFSLDQPLKELDQAYWAVNDVDRFVVHRDAAGQVTYAIFSDDRARYLDPESGVIDVETFAPGELTKTLCAPWIFDFRDCICFYWASSKPDITDGTNPPFSNFMRNRKNPPPPPTGDYIQWIGQRMKIGELISGAWKELPVVVNDREEIPLGKPGPLDPFANLAPKFTLDELINELKYLATVEHALIVEYLYAHYSLAAPLDLDDEDESVSADQKIIHGVARDVLAIAIDEMQHFLWVNKVLRLLECNEPITDRAEVIGLPPSEDTKFKRKEIEGFKYLRIRFSLSPLSDEVVKQFIDIETNSKSIDPNRTSFGMYVQILASLRNGKLAAPNAKQVIEMIKLLIDEGDVHGIVFSSIKERLDELSVKYLRDFNRAPNQYGREEQDLLVLADTYYHNVLELIHVSYQLADETAGDLIDDAITLMHKLHEVAHRLAEKGIGLRFTLPEPEKLTGTLKSDGPLKALDAGEERIVSQLSTIRDTGDDSSKKMAERHLESSRNLYQKMRRTVTGSG